MKRIAEAWNEIRAHFIGAAFLVMLIVEFLKWLYRRK